jgi:hypothetical protein
MKIINNKTPPPVKKFDGIIVGDELTGHERIEYICNFCNQNLVKISDRHGNNEEWFCRNCSIAFNPEDESVRHKQKLSTPDQNVEPLVATTPGQDYLTKKVEINHSPEIKGGLKALQQSGMKITHYEERVG